MGADPLQSARTKLARANLHKAVARRETRRFFNRCPDPAFRIEPEGDEDASSLAVGAVHRCRLVVEADLPDLPGSFAARFGDAIYNYRCALDHVAWQLVGHGSSWPLARRETFGVQFPIYSTDTDFAANRERRLPGADKAAVDFIEARHQYARGNATNDALLGLASLSNDDKHRELHVFLALFKTLETHVTFTRCRPLSWENPARRPALKAGAELARFSYRITEQDPEMKMELRPQAQIVIEDGRDFSEMLEGIAREVREILDAPEILAALT